MSSIKDRQRAAARARLEREMAARAEAARKRRQRQAIIGSTIAVVLIAAGTIWLVTDLTKGKGTKKSASSAPAGTVTCTWSPSAGGKAVNVGTPPATAPNVGTNTLTIDTNLGAITATVDLSKTPCTGAAFAFLSAKKFWDGTKCHRLTTQGIKVLQCGDPGAKGKGYRQTDGTGGPGFQYAEENLPAGKTPPYPAGTIAMAKTQQPGSTGSQFFIVYGDAQLDPAYTVLGTVTKGMDIVNKVAKAGSDNANGPGDGHPKTEVDIKTLTLAAS